LSPDRMVTVAAICIGSGGDREDKMGKAVDFLHIAGENHADVACLPESFAGNTPEAIPGATTQAIGNLARRYGMYVICPIYEQADGGVYNTAVLINRQGELAGCYRKVFVFWGEGVNLSNEGVKAFDTDFGRISILTCFDINFPELWAEADDLGSDIVFWPSAYGGGMPLNAFSMLYHYYIVPVGWGNIIDITGESITDFREPRENIFIATLDLDRTLIHTNFNVEKVAKLLKEHEGEVVQERYYDMESWYLLKAAKQGISVRQLCKEYQIEILREYIQRSRKEINEIRRHGGIV